MFREKNHGSRYSTQPQLSSFSSLMLSNCRSKEKEPKIDVNHDRKEVKESVFAFYQQNQIICIKYFTLNISKIKRTYLPIIQRHYGKVGKINK